MTMFTRESSEAARPVLFDLAKRLKLAGFPQTFGFTECEHRDIVTIYDTGNFALPDEISEDTESIYVPDLNSLIEHCGGRFQDLSRISNDRWHARGSINGESHEVAGETPWEAVAKLYIELSG